MSVSVTIARYGAAVLMTAGLFAGTIATASDTPDPGGTREGILEEVGERGEWIPLFDGETLDGWSTKAVPEDQDYTWWRVVDGAIEANSMERGDHDYVWLYSEEEFDDFVLRMKFQAFRDSPGNSGVQIRSRYDETDEGGWLNGPQIDIHPPGPWRTGMIWDETRGNQRWLYPETLEDGWVNESMAVDGVEFYYADDEPAWNSLEITAVGAKLQAVLNGVKVMEYDGAGVLDDENHQAHGAGLDGHLALQIHSGDRLRIRFKDIVIQPLSIESESE
ncbi:MAG: DUF1080 domain-containing protein [Candidatus Hydrogenedentota bacterium]